MKDMLHHKGYYGSVHFDEGELIFHGKIEFVRALVSYEASTARGLRKAFIDAVEDYLELCASRGTQPEAPFKGSLNVRLGTELHRRLSIAAAQQHLTLNKLINSLLEQSLARSLNA